MTTHLAIAKAFKRGYSMSWCGYRYGVTLAYVETAIRKYLR